MGFDDWEWGFCRCCQRLEPLNGDGTLAKHRTLESHFTFDKKTACKGSESFPDDTPDEINSEPP